MTTKEKYAWRIENFSTLTGTAAIYSETFLLKGHQWKILLNPVGVAKCLSAYLVFVDSKIVPDGWSLVVDFRLTLVDQLNRTSSKRTSYKKNLKKGEYGGYKFSAQICDLRKGFLVNDTLIIEAEVSTIQFIDPNLVAKVYTALESLDTRLYQESSKRSYNPYIFGSYTLKDISRRIPTTIEELQPISGVGKANTIKYGVRVLETIESTISDYYNDCGKKEGSGNSGNATSASTKDSGDPKVIESVANHQSKGDSVSPPLSNKVARTSTITSPCSLTVQLASKNLITELSSMASGWKPASIEMIPESTIDETRDSALLQQQRDKLADFFEMSLESISHANRFWDVNIVVEKIHELATDPSEKLVMKEFLPRLSELWTIFPNSLSIMEGTPEFETTPAHQRTVELEGSLLKRQKELTLLDSEVSRIEQERMKVEAEIQLLVALNDKLVREKNSAVAEMEAANREASKELGELKRKHREREQANGSRLRAKDGIAQSYASWKLFKKIWNYQKS